MYTLRTSNNYKLIENVFFRIRDGSHIVPRRCQDTDAKELYWVETDQTK